MLNLVALCLDSGGKLYLKKLAVSRKEGRDGGPKEACIESQSATASSNEVEEESTKKRNDIQHGGGKAGGSCRYSDTD